MSTWSLLYTVALENVRSYGTEGRELLDTTGSSTFVPPQDVVHAYLVFRGQDIKDLHVHEETNGGAATAAAADPSPKSTTTASDLVAAEKQEEVRQSESAAHNTSRGGGTSRAATSGGKATSGSTGQTKSMQQQKSTEPKLRKNMVGTGASLLNKNMRGGKGEKGEVLICLFYCTRIAIYQHACFRTLFPLGIPENVDDQFDFESNLAEFDKVSVSNDAEGDDAKENEEVYSKDDFFDSISCDALDKQHGIDNRLRGAAERSLNLDTFGAVSLGHGRRGRGGRGRGGRGGRGRGGYRGRGGRGINGNTRGGYDSSGRKNGYDQDGPGPRQNNRWKESN